MNPKLVIRGETDADIDAIRDVTVAAVDTLEISGHTEQFVIAALRAARSLALRQRTTKRRSLPSGRSRAGLPFRECGKAD
ncbi:MAG: hypothetical protein U1A72_12140 [Sulfuritalea sp.]|nr:hypothetical protein [Sulfuritalea sp.]